MPTGDEPTLVVWLVNQGVGVAVAAFLLWRVEKRLVDLNQAINNLTLALVRGGSINGKRGQTPAAGTVRQGHEEA